jgi:hypothetical protein
MHRATKPESVQPESLTLKTYHGRGGHATTSAAGPKYWAAEQLNGFTGCDVLDNPVVRKEFETHDREAEYDAQDGGCKFHGLDFSAIVSSGYSASRQFQCAIMPGVAEPRLDFLPADISK